MKKIMMFVAVALAAMMSQAATVAWKSGAITLQDGSKAAAGSVTMYVWELTENAYNALGGAEDIYKLGTETATQSVANKATGATINSTAYNANDKIYSAVLLSYKDASGTEWYKAQAMTDTVDALGSNVSFGSLAANMGSWAEGSGGGDVPEPTSGLLLLVGGAMLALRRKQK